MKLIRHAILTIWCPLPFHLALPLCAGDEFDALPEEPRYKGWAVVQRQLEVMGFDVGEAKRAILRLEAKNGRGRNRKLKQCSERVWKPISEKK